MTDFLMRRDSVPVCVRAQTINEDQRTVEAVITTDTPVRMYDWRNDMDVDEVLPPAAMVVRGGGDSVPLLDCHNRSETDDIVGRAGNFRIEDGSVLATLRFDDDDKSDRVFRKIRSGSLTDLSIGYSVQESQILLEGETVNVGGRSYSGPAKVALRYELQEVSTVPIGADYMAKIRALNNKSGNEPEQKTKQEAHQMADEPQAPVPPEPTPAAPLDVDKLRSEAEARALERYATIRSIAKDAGLSDDEADKAIRENVTAEQFREAAFAKLCERNKPVLGDPKEVKVEVSGEQRDKKRAAMTDGLRMRAGVKVSSPAPGAEDFRGFSLVDLARECLIEQGVTPGDALRMSRESALERALNNRNRDRVTPNARAYNHTTSDFPLLLADAMNKNLQDAYTLANVTWNQFCSTTSVSDFKPRKVIKLSEGKAPSKVLENGEIQESDYIEAQEQYRVHTYGQIVSVTRETLINDDLSAFSRIPASMGGQFARNIEMLVYSVILGNDNMSDGVELYAAGHGNLDTSGGVPSVATLQAAFAKMAKQTGPQGSILNIRPSIIVVPPDIAGTVAQVINSTVDPSKSNSAINPYANSLSVVSSPYLNTAFTFDGKAYNGSPDNNAWYLFADPSTIDTIEVAFLNGNQNPVLEEEEGFETLGIKFRAYHDVGAKAIDWRGTYKNDGGA